jgi:hypothetical protein
MAEKMTLEEVMRAAVLAGVVLNKADGPNGSVKFDSKTFQAFVHHLNAHLTQPAQAVDVGALRDMIEDWRVSANAHDELQYSCCGDTGRRCADELESAIGNAQAEGWKVPEGWSVTPERNPLGGKPAMRLRAPDGRSGLYGSFSEEVLVRDFLTSLSPTPPQPEE